MTEFHLQTYANICTVEQAIGTFWDDVRIRDLPTDWRPMFTWLDEHGFSYEVCCHFPDVFLPTERCWIILRMPEDEHAVLTRIQFDLKIFIESSCYDGF